MLPPVSKVAGFWRREAGGTAALSSSGTVIDWRSVLSVLVGSVVSSVERLIFTRGWVFGWVFGWDFGWVWERRRPGTGTGTGSDLALLGGVEGADGRAVIVTAYRLYSIERRMVGEERIFLNDRG